MVQPGHWNIVWEKYLVGHRAQLISTVLEFYTQSGKLVNISKTQGVWEDAKIDEVKV